MNSSLQGINSLAPFNAGTMRERKYLAIRYEGSLYLDALHDTAPGDSNSIYEIYMFADGWTELRIGNWESSNRSLRKDSAVHSFGDPAGCYDLSDVGFPFPNFGANTCYTFWRSGEPLLSAYLNPTYLFAGHIYEKGEFVSTNSLGDRSPIEGTNPTPPTSWPPAGWFSVLDTDTRKKNITLYHPTVNVDEAFAGNLDTTLFNFYDFSMPSNIYVSSAGFITFSYTSVFYGYNVNHDDTVYSLGTDYNQNVRRIVIGANPARSFQQVAWKVGYK